ncbi:DUF6615 family protein [Lysobacter antibioticus]|uniref:DUF6615 family protein n=1 Tax=Lysobacter antibioticus TaxID=84531 RepID=UPI00126A5C11|nr:DUF6615 family protein [Lysobacter antibioticus]
MHYTLTPEQLALLDASRTVWARRAAVKRHRLPFGEESITETILGDLANNYPGDLSIIAFNKREEGRVGADWAWAFISADGKYSIPMLVQAKLLDLSDVNYPEISRAIGRRKPAVRQIDRLIASAEELGWPALYAFYNHLDDPSRIPYKCRSLAMQGTQMPESWGISIAHAESVRAALDDQSFDTHRMHSIALHCLLCSRGLGIRPAFGSPELLLNGLVRLRDLAEDNEIGISSISLLPDTLFTELPHMFRVARDMASAQSFFEYETLRDEVAQRYPDIAGVVIFRDGVE